MATLKDVKERHAKTRLFKRHSRGLRRLTAGTSIQAHNDRAYLIGLVERMRGYIKDGCVSDTPEWADIKFNLLEETAP